MAEPLLLPGASMPDIDLPDHAGNDRRLSELVGGDPTIVHFFRGWWCPKEQEWFRRLVSLQDAAEVGYCHFVSVSVDSPEVTAAFRAGLGARWTFLCDHERRWVDRLGLVETTDPARPYLPTVFTVDPELRIHSRYDGYWFWGRASVEELWQDLRALTRALTRDDWLPPQ